MVKRTEKSAAESVQGIGRVEALPQSAWDRWREWVRTSHPPPFHTPEWLAVQAHAFRGDPMCFAVIEGGEVADVVPVVLRGLGPFRVGSSPVHVGTPYGGTSNRPVTAELARRLVEAARAQGLSFLDVYVDPRVTVGDPEPFRVQSHSTYVLSLDPDETAVLDRMESRCRRAIRKATRLGVTVRDMTVEDIPAYKRMAVDTYAHQGRTPPLPIEIVEACLAQASLRNQVLPLLAEMDGQPLAAGLFPWGGDTVYYADGVSFRSGLKFSPNNVLHWGVIQRAIRLGLRRYDLVGASVGSIALFKRSFGARVVPHSRIHWGTPAARAAYRAWKWTSRPSRRRDL